MQGFLRGSAARVASIGQVGAASRREGQSFREPESRRRGNLGGPHRSAGSSRRAAARAPA